MESSQYNRLLPGSVLLMFLLSFLAAVCSGSAKPKTEALVLSYGEIGPSVLVYELIGNEWYQWNKHGDSDPNSIDNVEVVVYRNISLEAVKKLYPVNEKTKSDYRYLEYKTALDYLNEHEDEEYLEHLRTTKKKIIENLGS